MVGGQHPNRREENNGLGRGEPARRKRASSRGVWVGVGAAVALALFIALVGVIAAQAPSDDPESQAPAPGRTPTPVEPTRAPPEVTPRPRYSEAVPEEDVGDDDFTITAGVVTPEPTSSTVQSPSTAASSWSAGPTPVPVAPASPTSPEAARLAEEANQTYGVRIILDGQDWGDTEAAQVANLQTVISAIDRLPDTVISAVVTHPYGPLTFVSNDEGRTLDGWQPYGGHSMTYYTNSDQGPSGYHASNQVVLGVGSGSLSIGHEILHSYQFRNVNSDQYALALLQPEMRSFMEAAGWKQTGSDEEVRQAVNQPWSALDSLYVYEGRTLTYATTGGITGTMTASNPAEAFAITGAVYYTRPSWMPLPDWSEYWAWFRANVA